MDQEKINLLRFGMLLFAVAWLGLLLLLPDEAWRRSLYAAVVIAGICLELWGYAALAQHLRFQFKRATLEAFCDAPDDASATEKALNYQSLARIGSLNIPELEPQGRWLHEVAVWGIAIAGSGIIGLNSRSVICGEFRDICWDQTSGAGLGLVFVLFQGGLAMTALLLTQYYAKHFGDRQGLDCFELRQTLPQPHWLFWKWLRSLDPVSVLVLSVQGVVWIPLALLFFFVGGTHLVGDAITAVAAIPLLGWVGGLLFKPLAHFQTALLKPYQAAKFCTSCGQVAIACASEPMQTAFQEQSFAQDPNERIAHELDNISYVGWRCQQCHPEDVLNAYYWQRLRSHDKTLCPECHHDTVDYQVKSNLVKGADVHHERCRICYYHNSNVVPRRRRRVSSGGAGTTYYGPSEYSFGGAGSSGECGGGYSAGDFGGGDFGGGESGGGGAGEGW